jgi:iron(III) transport system substrate-binding protein
MSLAATAVNAAAPAPYQVTDELIAAAKKEGKVVLYTSMDVQVAERLAAAFEAKYPGIDAQIERAGSERIFQRVGQEYTNGINYVDVLDTSDAVHSLLYQKRGWLMAAVPEELAQLWPAEERDPDGFYASFRAHLSVIAYNKNQVTPEAAPKTYADLLDPKWKGKLVKAHPGYSGTIMTSTIAITRALGWEYLEKLSKQDIMQVQSSTEPPKKLAQGERAVQVDGNEYNVFLLQESGVPLEVVYPPEGTPLVVGNASIMSEAPHPNAAKLFYAFLFSLEAQQLNSDLGGLRSFHPGVKEKAGRIPLSDIKLLHTDPHDVESEMRSIRQTYEKYFGV